MTLEPVQGSSHIAAAGYDEHEQTLQIRFQDGRTYLYSGVPQGIHAALMASGSPGGYFWTHIRNRYAYEEV